jgi:hypothetical protein
MAAKVPATVLWEGIIVVSTTLCDGTVIVLWEGIIVVSTTLCDGTVIVLPYQVALRLQEGVEVGDGGLLTTMQAVLLSSPLPCWHGVFATCSPSVIQP